MADEGNMGEALVAGLALTIIALSASMGQFGSWAWLVGLAFGSAGIGLLMSTKFGLNVKALGRGFAGLSALAFGVNALGVWPNSYGIMLALLSLVVLFGGMGAKKLPFVGKFIPG